MTELTAEVLRSKLDYNHETGVFTWRVRAGKAWPGRVAGSPDSWGHTQIRINTRKYAAHRLAWLYMTGGWPADMLDHIDGNPANNAFRNLREVDTTINQQNQRRAHADNKSGVMGASPLGKKWKACITVNKQFFYLGAFDTAEQAGAAYLDAKRRLHAGCTV